MKNSHSLPFFKRGIVTALIDASSLMVHLCTCTVTGSKLSSISIYLTWDAGLRSRGTGSENIGMAG